MHDRGARPNLHQEPGSADPLAVSAQSPSPGLHMLEHHMKKLRLRDSVSPEEEAAIYGMIGDIVDHPAHSTIVHAGRDVRESLLLCKGWLGRVKDLPSGQRQMTELHVPGDFADLHGFTLKSLDHDVVTLTACRIALVPHDRLRKVTADFPHIARLYWTMTNIDAAIHREWMLSLGRRSALARMAHLFCELLVRLRISGLTDGDSYDFPLTQVELGECLGLTSVHVNRTLQELRRMNLIQVEGRRATILNLPELQGVADFDDQYLYLEPRPR